MLLGHPESTLAAAVIEGHRFSYVYKQTKGRQSTGDSQVSLLDEVAMLTHMFCSRISLTSRM